MKQPLSFLNTMKQRIKLLVFQIILMWKTINNKIIKDKKVKNNQPVALVQLLLLARPECEYGVLLAPDVVQYLCDALLHRVGLRLGHRCHPTHVLQVRFARLARKC